MDTKETKGSEPTGQVREFNLRALSDAVFQMPTELLDRTLETALRKPPSEVRDRALARLCRRFAGLGQDSQAIKALKAIKSDAWQWNTLLANVLHLGADAFDQAVSLACELYRYYSQGSVALSSEWDQMQISYAIKELLIRQAIFGKADLAWQNRSSFDALEDPYFRLQSLLAFTPYIPVDLSQAEANFLLDEDLELSIDAAAYFSVEQLDQLFNQALKTDRLLDLAPVIQFLPPGQADAVFSAVVETRNFYKVNFQALPPEMLERLLALDDLDVETQVDLALCKPISQQALLHLVMTTPITKIRWQATRLGWSISPSYYQIYTCLIDTWAARLATLCGSIRATPTV